MPLPWWDERTLDAIRRIESGGRDYTTTGSNRGPFQMGPREWSRYGGGGDVFNRSDATAAAKRKFADDAGAYRQDFGDDPTGDKLYLYHQQGRAGGREHLRNPEGVAWQNIRKFYPSDAIAKKAIWGNVPSDMRSLFRGGVNSLTSGQFADMWRNKFARFAGAPLGAPMGMGQAAAAPQGPAGPPPAIMASARAQMPGRIGSLGGLVPGEEQDFQAGYPGTPGFAAVEPPLPPPPEPPPMPPMGPPGPPTVPPVAMGGMSPEGEQDFQTMFPGATAFNEPVDQPPPPPAPPPLHDPSAFAGGQLPQVPGIATTPVEPRMPGITSSVPPPPGTDTAPGPVFGPPIPSEIMERRGPGRPGMTPDDGGGFYRYFTKDDKPQGARGFFSTAYNAFANPLTGAGLNLLFPQAKAGEILAGAAGRRGAERRAEESLQLQKEHGQRERLTWEEKMEEINRAKRAYSEMFPSGQADPTHPALKNLPPELVEAIRGLPPADAVKATSELRFKTQAQREALAQEMERMRLIQQMEEGGAAPAAAAPGPASSPMAPAVPPSAGVPSIGQPAGMSVPEGPAPSLPPMMSLPPPTAPAPPSPGAPAAPVAPPSPTATRAPPVAEEPMVEVGNRRFTIPEARRRLEIQKRFKQETGLQDAINAAEARGVEMRKEAQPPPAIKEAAYKTDQAYADMTGSLDRYNAIIQKYPGQMGFIGKSADRDIARGERNNIILLAKDLYGLGQLSKADLDLALSLPDPELRLMPAPFSGDDAGINIPGWSLSDRTQATVEAMKERIRNTRNIKGAAIGMPEIPAPPPKEEKKIETKEKPTDIRKMPDGSTRYLIDGQWVKKVKD